MNYINFKNDYIGFLRNLIQFYPELGEEARQVIFELIEKLNLIEVLTPENFLSLVNTHTTKKTEDNYYSLFNFSINSYLFLLFHNNQKILTDKNKYYALFAHTLVHMYTNFKFRLSSAVNAFMDTLLLISFGSNCEYQETSLFLVKLFEIMLPNLESEYESISPILLNTLYEALHFNNKQSNTEIHNIQQSSYFKKLELFKDKNYTFTLDEQGEKKLKKYLQNANMLYVNCINEITSVEESF
jgi:hypothetical protein